MLITLLRSRRHRRRQRGAVAVIVAVSVVALFVAAGLVLNIGLARVDKITNKGYADSASAAGARNLFVGDGVSRPFAGGCAALRYLQASDPAVASINGSWTTGAGVSVGHDPCTTGSSDFDATCTSGDATTYAWFTGTVGAVSVTIKSGYLTPDPGFDATGSTDNSASGGCDQLAVFIRQSESAGLGKVVRQNDVTTIVRTVARLGTLDGGDASAALLILERTACPAISVNSSNTFIEVKGFGTKPGVVHSDSNGSGSGCSSSSPVIAGKFSSPPGISARQAESADATYTTAARRPGQITTVAGTGAGAAVSGNATDGSSKVCAEAGSPVVSSTTAPSTCQAAGGRALVGRGPVDRRYNTSTTTGVQTAMTAAATEYSKSPSGDGAGTSGYTVIGGSDGACNNMTTTDFAAAGTTSGPVFVNCPNGITINNFTFSNASQVVFNGNVEVGSGNLLSMPKATRVYIRGSTTTNGGLLVQGNLKLNNGTMTSCPSGVVTSPLASQLVIGTGSFASGAQSVFHMCQTSVIMSNKTIPSGVPCPPPTPPVAGTGLAPYNNNCQGSVNLTGSGTVDWTAPNRVGAGATATDWQSLEDMALWTEASASSSIGGGGALNISGVFFLPNAAPFNIAGNGSQMQPANAQFVARQLVVKGGGTLYMRPDPNDSFTLSLTDAVFNLVR